MGSLSINYLFTMFTATRNAFDDKIYAITLFFYRRRTDQTNISRTIEQFLGRKIARDPYRPSVINAFDFSANTLNTMTSAAPSTAAAAKNKEERQRKLGELAKPVPLGGGNSPERSVDKLSLNSSSGSSSGKGSRGRVHPGIDVPLSGLDTSVPPFTPRTMALLSGASTAPVRSAVYDAPATPVLLTPIPLTPAPVTPVTPATPFTICTNKEGKEPSVAPVEHRRRKYQRQSDMTFLRFTEFLIFYILFKAFTPLLRGQSFFSVENMCILGIATASLIACWVLESCILRPSAKVVCQQVLLALCCLGLFNVHLCLAVLGISAGSSGSIRR